MVILIGKNFLLKVIAIEFFRSVYAYKYVARSYFMDNSQSTPEPTVDFGSKKTAKSNMGHAEESPGHLEKKFTKGATGKDRDISPGSIDILPPFSKAKIKSANLKIKGDV